MFDKNNQVTPKFFIQHILIFSPNEVNFMHAKFETIFTGKGL